MRKIICMVMASIWLFSAGAFASQSDTVYTYNSKDEAVPSPGIYQVEYILDGAAMGCTNLNGAQDLFVDGKNHLYILDSGNRRVVILDENYHCIGEITEFTDDAGPTTLGDGAQGIFYHEDTGMLYVADTANNRILVSDLTGKLYHVYGKPESELLDPALPYSPRKIIVDNMGLMYVTSTHVNTGALLINGENTFLGFYGINSIKETFEIIIEYMWRGFLTDEQNAQSTASFQPTEFNNLFWSAEERFVYAVSPERESLESPVVKLNAVGNNVFPSDATFGDGEPEVSRFMDITVDSDKVFTLLNNVNGRLYQYDDGCNLIAVFGGLGTQKGLFTTPTSLESDSQNRLLVLDATKNTITVLDLTYYGRQVRQATMLHNDGLYEEALELWQEVLMLNANCNLAYVGLGKAYMELGDYDLAKEHFKMAGDQENYGKAKGSLRNVWIRDNFAVLVVVISVLMVLVLSSDGIKKLCAPLTGRIRIWKEAKGS